MWHKCTLLSKGGGLFSCLFSPLQTFIPFSSLLTAPVLHSSLHPTHMKVICTSVRLFSDSLYKAMWDLELAYTLKWESSVQDNTFCSGRALWWISMNMTISLIISTPGTAKPFQSISVWTEYFLSFWKKPYYAVAMTLLKLLAETWYLHKKSAQGKQFAHKDGITE